MILAGDIGGTKTHLALFKREGQRLSIVSDEKFVSRDHPGLEHVIEKFLASRRQLLQGVTFTSAAFGIAGPVIGDICKTPNLPWVIDAKVIRATIGAERVKLLNDLEANGYGIPMLADDQFADLNPRGVADPAGHAVLVSAGTGLGEAFLFNNGKDLIPVASEGGHADFAPRNDLEIELLRYLRKKWHHVSYERILSGPGLFNVYCFFRDTGKGEEPAWLSERIAKGDPAAAVSQAALKRESDLAVMAMDLFLALYGAEAGNMALKTKALGGVFIGGGIAPRIIERMKDGIFMKNFLDKGRLTSMIETMPVRVILNAQTALLGAGRCAGLL